MAENHPQHIDPRPKRRRDKDNPYEIFTVGIDTAHPHYYIRFKDGRSVEHCLEIEKELFDLFNRFELDDLSFLNKVDRHYSLSEQSEESLHRHALHLPGSVEDAVIRKFEYEKLKEAIATLPETQRRRFVLYYSDRFTYEEIASIENCSVHSAYVAVKRAREKIKKIWEQV